MRPSWKKMFKDMWNHKIRTLSIILAVSITISVYSGMMLSYDAIWAARSLNYEELNFHDGRANFDFLPLSMLENLSTNIDNLSSINKDLGNLKQIMFLLDVPSIVKWEDEEYTAQVMGINATSEPVIDKFEYRTNDSSYFSGEGKREILLEYHFATSNDVQVGDQIEIYTGYNYTKFTVVGIVFHPAYIYSTNPYTKFSDPYTFAAIWMPLDTLQELLYISGMINEIVFTVKNTDKLNETTRALKNYIEDKAPGITVSTHVYTEEPDYIMFNEDTKGFKVFASGFAVIIILVGGFLIYDSISRLINSQRFMIGIMRSLGAKRRSLFMHYFMHVIILLVVGIILGIPLGFGMMLEFENIYIETLGISFRGMVFHYGPFVESALMISIVAILVSSYVIYKLLKITPREALYSSYVIEEFSKAPLIERTVNLLPVKKKNTWKIPIRKLFRHKKRTLITMFTLAMTMMIFISSFGFVDSMFSYMDNMYNNYDKFDLQVHFIQPYNYSYLEEQMSRVNSLEKFEGFLMKEVDVYDASGDIKKSSAVLGLNSNMSLKKIYMVQGKTLDKLAKDEIIIALPLANDLGVGINDTIKFQKKTWKIGGIYSALIENYVIMSLDDVWDLFDLKGNYSGIYVKAKSGIDPNQLKKDILKETDLQVSLFIKKDFIMDLFERMMEALIGMSLLLGLIGFLVISVFTFSISVLDVMDREREFVNYRILGGRRWNIFLMIFVEMMFVTLGSFILAIPLGYFFTDYLLSSYQTEGFYMPTYVSPNTYFLSFIVALISVIIGVLMATRHVQKINLAESTRNMVI